MWPGLMRNWFIVAMLCMALFSLGCRTARRLEQGDLVQEPLLAGASHRYQLRLQSGDYLRLAAVQQGVDLVMTLRLSQKAVVTADGQTRILGPEPLHYLAEESGTYELEVLGLNHLGEGHYQLRVLAAGPSSVQDRARVAAFARLCEARALRDRGEDCRAAFQEAVDQCADTPELYVSARLEQALALLREGSSSQALQLLEDLVSGLDSESHTLHLVAACWGLAQAHMQMGMWEQGVKAWETAAHLAKLSGDPLLELVAHRLAGVACAGAGLHESAINFQDQARELAASQGLLEAEATACDGLGLNYSQMGRTQLARTYLDQAAGFWRDSDNNPKLARNRIWHGWTLSLDGDVGAAESAMKAALELVRETGDAVRLAVAYDRLGSVLRKGGRFQEALVHYRNALDLIPPDSENAAHTMINIAETLNGLEEWDESLALLETARSGLHPKNLHHLAHIHYLNAFALLGLDRKDEALSVARECLNALEGARMKVYNPLLGRGFSHSRDFYFENLAALFMDLGEQEQALIAVEQNRARSLAFRTAGRLADVDGLMDKAAEELAAITRRIDQLQASRGRVEPTSFQEEMWDLLLARYREFAAMAAQIRSLAPSKPTFQVKDIQTRLLDEDTLLLVYELGEDRSFVWAVARDAFQCYTLPPRSQIEARVGQLYQLLAENDGIGQQAKSKADWLSRHLLAPMLADFPEKRLWIVKDEALHYLPFAMLPIKDQPLIATRDLAMLPSVGYGLLLRKLLARRTPAPRTIAVFADPVFQPPGEASKEIVPSESLKRTLEERSMDKLPPLHYSREEARAILAMVDQDLGRAMLGYEAEPHALAEGKSYRILHFATHSFIHPKYQELSGIVLSLYDQQGRPRDGFLRTHLLETLDLPIELATLSACSTATGDQVRGEGVWGLAHAMMVAGAARVLVSLWNVDDRATARLMTHFYRGLFMEGKDPAAALSHAQRMMWRESHSPFHWAAFELQGEWRPFFSK